MTPAGSGPHEPPPPVWGGVPTVMAWAKARSLSALTLVGALPVGMVARPLEASPHIAWPGMAPARAPGHADLLVIIGHVSHKLLPHLLRTHARLAKPSFVLHLRGPAGDASGYALIADLERYLPIDVLVQGALDDAPAIGEGLSALQECIRRRRGPR